MSSEVRDFSITEPTSPTQSPARVTFEDDIDAPHHPSDRNALQARSTFGSLHTQSNPDLSEKTPGGVHPILKRRKTRSSTSRTIHAVDDYHIRPDWKPGQEPGIDPSKENGGRGDKPTLHAECDITIVDYSEDDMVMYHLTNDTLPEWLEEHGKKEDWIKCRWINVNGLSWDVISALGKYKKLHRLAIEDLMNTKNRTKADWYADHTYIVLTLQKLVHLHPDGDANDDDESSTFGSKKSKKRGQFMKAFQQLFGSDKSWKDGGKANGLANGDLHNPELGYVAAHTEGTRNAPVQKLRTLQRYHGGPNQERMAYMEEKSPLTEKDRAVCAEQVSIFLTADNTVISFFEASAEDIETPILNRLATPDTILRRSCDASMLTQALIDAIIDLAIPVATAYQNVIGELELDVLTEPNIKHTTRLYIVTSEITTMRNFISPIASLISALRDHKSEPISMSALSDKSMSTVTGIKISPMTHMYLGDVEDHCVLITQSLDQMHQSAGGMIDLIFNTISAYQNESMKQLTVVTIVFLPLTFITGYFGMNFTQFTTIIGTEAFFWKIAVPTGFGTALLVMSDMIWRWATKTVQKRGISQNRKWRLRREAEAKRGR